MSPQEDKTARAVATGAELGVRAHAAGHLPLCHPFPEKEGAGQPGPLLRALGKFSFASSAAVVGGLGPFFPVSVTQLSQLQSGLSKHSRGDSQDGISEAAGKAE